VSTTGPFRAGASAPTTLVIATTHDPATPYCSAKRLVADLAIDAAVDAYLEERTLPAPGTVCRQEVPFAAPAAAALLAPESQRAKRPLLPHMKPR
jgi:hypothetical protein